MRPDADTGRGTHDARPERMISRLLTDPRLVRLGLVVLALVLAACNPGNNSGGGGPAY